MRTGDVAPQQTNGQTGKTARQAAIFFPESDYPQRTPAGSLDSSHPNDLAADDFCLQEFFATEAAFCAILMLFNLLGEFQRASGIKGYRQPATLWIEPTETTAGESVGLSIGNFAEVVDCPTYVTLTFCHQLECL